jgi:acetyltransferase-like isoleucine patch superfamily enzyme
MAVHWRVRGRNVAAALTHRGWEAVVWAGGIGPHDRIARRFCAMGEGALICFPPGSTFGERHIRIGAHTMIGPHVGLSVGMAPGQPMPYAAADGSVLRIGERCSIGRGTHLVAHRSIDVGDDVITGPNCYVTDQNHVYADPDVPIAQQWPAEDAVVIGAGSWLGAGAIVLPGSRLGRNTVVGAGSVVRGEYGDHAVLAGVPARMVRTYDPANGWQPALRDLQIDPPAGWPSPHT